MSYKELKTSIDVKLDKEKLLERRYKNQDDMIKWVSSCLYEVLVVELKSDLRVAMNKPTGSIIMSTEDIMNLVKKNKLANEAYNRFMGRGEKISTEIMLALVRYT